MLSEETFWITVRNIQLAGWIWGGAATRKNVLRPYQLHGFTKILTFLQCLTFTWQFWRQVEFAIWGTKLRPNCLVLISGYTLHAILAQINCLMRERDDTYVEHVPNPCLGHFALCGSSAVGCLREIVPGVGVLGPSAPFTITKPGLFLFFSSDIDNVLHSLYRVTLCPFQVDLLFRVARCLVEHVPSASVVSSCMCADWIRSVERVHRLVKSASH